jgi:glycosyltransferase involved in cell wall biosynthesis
MVDIKPKGFSAIELGGYVTDAAVRKTRQILENPELRKKMVDQNYQIAKEFFSYSILRQRVKSFLEEPVTVLKDFDYY